MLIQHLPLRNNQPNVLPACPPHTGYKTGMAQHQNIMSYGLGRVLQEDKGSGNRSCVLLHPLHRYLKFLFCKYLYPVVVSKCIRSAKSEQKINISIP